MSEPQRLLYLIRHGATTANLQRPYVLQGRATDLPLSHLGRRQAEAACRVLEHRAIDLVFSSPLRRARETAEILAAPLHTPVESVDELIECDVGRWEGLSWETIRQQDQTYWESFEADLANVPYAGGESFQQVQDRVVPALERLLREHETGDLIVVTHNVVARVYLAHVIGIPTAQARSIRQDNAGITVLSLTGSTTKLLTLNSTVHLEGLDPE